MSEKPQAKSDRPVRVREDDPGPWRPMKLGRIAGTDLIVHPTFWLIIALVGFLSLTRGVGIAGAAAEIAFVLVIFGCVVLHEFGHVLAARRYGIGTRAVTLYPIGGVAQLERTPENPKHELVVALAGPAVNVAIAAVVAPTLLVLDSTFLARLAFVNVLLVVFNMVPAFPMDGGRVLRALLAMRLPYVRATNIAAGVGRLMIVPFVLGGLFWNPLLLVIGAFVWFAATAEARAVQMRESLAGARVMQASMAQVFSLSPEDRLAAAVELTLDSVQKDFPITRDGVVIGALAQPELLEALEKLGSKAIVGDVMRPSPPGVEADSPLVDALETMQRTASPFLPVSEDGNLVGILTEENVREFMRLREAFGGRAPIRYPRRGMTAEPVMLN